MKTDKLITRFLDGLTSIEEERLLSETLEAQTTLTEDERAVLDLLRLTFPEEDTAALLTEDLSTEFERMANDESRMTNKVFLQQLMVTSIRHSSSLIHHWPFAIMATAAAILIAFILWPESYEAPITQPEQQPVIVEVSPLKLSLTTSPASKNEGNFGEGVGCFERASAQITSTHKANNAMLPLCDHTKNWPLPPLTGWPGESPGQGESLQPIASTIILHTWKQKWMHWTTV